MNSVAVLMSTYNGEKYIREQIDSILKQKNVDVTLFIRDDGSTDTTPLILAEYQKKYKNIIVEYEKNIGVAISFMTLLYNVSNDYDYYAFSDQDDVWLDNKLCESIRILKKSNKMLYASNQICVDEFGNNPKLRFDEDYRVKKSTVSILEQNELSGCTLVFTKQFKIYVSEEKRRPENRMLKLRMHDVWVLLVACLSNELIYDKRSFIKYRIHNNNVVGIKKATWFGIFIKQIKKIGNRSKRNGRSITAYNLCKCYPELTANRMMVNMFAQVHTLNGKRYLISNASRLVKYTGETICGFSFKTILGLI